MAAEHCYSFIGWLAAESKRNRLALGGLAHAHTVNRRYVVGYRLPGIAPILAEIEVARRAAEGEGVAATAKRVTQNDVIGVVLR